MKTLQEFAEEKSKFLDEQWKEKYPNGSFTVQIRPTSNNLHWNKRRRTSVTSYKGVSVSQIGEEIIESNYQNNSWGKIKVFDNLESAVKYAQKKGFSKALIDRFVERYYMERGE